MSQFVSTVVVSPNSGKSLFKPSTRLIPIRTPSRTIIGEVILEGDRRVFVRHVTERIRFRLHDAWPLGAYALQQLVRWRVTLLRYLAPDGTYEVSLTDFIAQSIAMEFPGHDEVQHVLPRSWWPVQPRDAQRSAVQEQLPFAATEEVR